MLYGSDIHRVFHHWWETAKDLYGLGSIRGDRTDRSTRYYDPLVAYHHMTTAGGHVTLSFELIGQKNKEARLLFKGAAEHLGWTSLDPMKEGALNYTTLQPEPSGTIKGLTLSREFGEDAIYAKLKAYAELNYEPTWDHESGEFTWGFGLGEPYPRGQYNAGIAIHEAGGPDAIWRIYNKPNFKKFIEPTVYGVNFPTICLSQAWYDADRRTLILSTDAGLRHAIGNTTSFRVGHTNVNNVNVMIDGQLSDQWSVVDGELEITTTVGEHTIMISH
jgi:hypothetical protein